MHPGQVPSITLDCDPHLLCFICLHDPGPSSLLPSLPGPTCVPPSKGSLEIHSAAPLFMLFQAAFLHLMNKCLCLTPHSGRALYLMLKRER